jgi:hypothetical protein
MLYCTYTVSIPTARTSFGTVASSSRLRAIHKAQFRVTASLSRKLTVANILYQNWKNCHFAIRDFCPLFFRDEFQGSQTPGEESCEDDLKSRLCGEFVEEILTRLGGLR